MKTEQEIRNQLETLKGEIECLRNDLANDELPETLRPKIVDDLKKFRAQVSILEWVLKEGE